MIVRKTNENTEKNNEKSLKLELYLQRHPEMETRCSKGGEVTCLTTERASTFDSKAKRFFGEPTKSVQIRL
jgi:glutamate racemase